MQAFGGFAKISAFIEDNQQHHAAGNVGESCEGRLAETFRKDFSQKDNLSKLTSKARGAQKSQCLEQIGGYPQVSTFLSNVEKNKTEESSLASGKKPTTSQTAAPIVIPSKSKTTATTTGALQN